MAINLMKWALIGLIVTACSECQATVLYVRFSPSEIVIGTDSKRTAETGDTVCVCKISQIGDMFVASAGLAEYGAFDPRNIAHDAIQDSGNLIEARARFEQLIEQPLIEVLTKIRTRNRPRYEAFKKGAAVNMIFARFINQAELVTTALTPRDAADGSIVLVKTQITLLGNVTRTKRIFVGLSKRVEVVLDRPSFWAKGVIAGIQRALEMSIEDNSEAGGPIDIVQLRRGTVRWFPREPQCDLRSRRMGEQPSTCNSSNHRSG